MSVDAQDLDCYASISGGAAPRAVERLGLQGQSWLRSSYEHLPIAVAGAVDDLGDGRLALTGDPVVAPVGAGTITITARGELELEETTGDPWHGLTPPADPTCGWDVRPSPDYDGAWHLAVGAQLPDGLFADACGQGVRLHDLAGSYLVVEISALDCGPCQQMASEVRLFQDLALQHLRRVEVVTLLAPSLSAPLDPTPPSLLTLWSETFGLASPVLGDRGWGITMSEDAFGGLSYPTWIIASPSLEVVATGQGFGGWTPILDTLLAHHE